MMLFVSHAKGGTTGELWTRSGQMEALLAPARPFRRSTGVKGGATWHEGRSSTAAGLIRANAWSTRGAPKPLDTCRPWTDQGGMGRRHQGPLRQPEPHEDARDGAIPRSSVRGTQRWRQRIWERCEDIALATTEVWNGAGSATTSLAKKVDEGTPTLLHDIGPQHRYMVRQALSACQQQTGESSATFANRLLNLVRAATTGQDHSSQKERVLEEFVARLRPDIRYYVKLDNPLTFEQAVAKAQMVEQLLAEATADRLINPVGAARMIEVKAVAAKPPRTNFGERRYVRRSLSRTNRPRFFQQSARNQDVSRQHGIPDCRLVPSRSNCFNCGGLGHHARQCQSPAVQLPASGRRQSSLRGALPFYDRQRFSSSSVNAVYPDSDALSQELSQAREQFNALSISLRNSQAACEHSEARVSALIKRNEELASSAFGQLSQSSLRSPHNLPDVRLLFACSLILTLCTSTNAACVNSPFSVSDAFNASNLVTIGRSLGYCQ
ncbi:hypothetical protein RB195_022043 [Necator americanus]|uniref:CCHC-type domain-containing protein n=1 Tax=Necator americanus TaxID=51031 RepID=A0ABR1EE14_NECAM